MIIVRFFLCLFISIGLVSCGGDVGSKKSVRGWDKSSKPKPNKPDKGDKDKDDKDDKDKPDKDDKDDKDKPDKDDKDDNVTIPDTNVTIDTDSNVTLEPVLSVIYIDDKNIDFSKENKLLRRMAFRQMQSSLPKIEGKYSEKFEIKTSTDQSVLEDANKSLSKEDFNVAELFVVKSLKDVNVSSFQINITIGKYKENIIFKIREIEEKDFLKTQIAFGNATDDIVYDVLTSELGDIYVLGTTTGGVKNDAKNVNVFLNKYDKNLKQKWTRSLASSVKQKDSQELVGILKPKMDFDEKGNIVIVGFTTSDLVLGEKFYERTSFIASFNSSGDENFVKTIIANDFKEIQDDIAIFVSKLEEATQQLNDKKDEKDKLKQSLTLKEAELKKVQDEISQSASSFMNNDHVKVIKDTWEFADFIVKAGRVPSHDKDKYNKGAEGYNKLISLQCTDVDTLKDNSLKPIYYALLNVYISMDDADSAKATLRTQIFTKYKPIYLNKSGQHDEIVQAAKDSVNPELIAKKEKLEDEVNTLKQTIENFEQSPEYKAIKQKEIDAKSTLLNAKLENMKINDAFKDIAISGKNVYILGQKNSVDPVCYLALYALDENKIEFKKKTNITQKCHESYSIDKDSSGNIYTLSIQKTSNLNEYKNTITKFDSFIDEKGSYGFNTYIFLANKPFEALSPMLKIHDNNIFIVGTTEKKIDDSASNVSNDKTASSVYLYKLSKEGIETHANLNPKATYLFSKKRDHGVAIAIDKNSELYIAGSTSGKINGVETSTDSDAFLARFDQDLKLISLRHEKSIGDGVTNSEQVNAVAITKEDQVVIGGQTRGSLGGDYKSGEDGFIIKYNSKEKIKD